MKELLKSSDKYTREARIYPTFLAFLPIGVLFYSLQESISQNAFLKTFSSSILLIIFVYFVVDLVRNLGKTLEIKVFKNELSFPTTELLLHSNDLFSKEKKKLIYKKIKEDFELNLLSASEESNDQLRARKRINEAVGQIRQKLDKGRLLLKYNIRYGFWRNLIATSPLSVGCSIFSSLFCSLLLKDINLGILILATSSVYGVLWILRESLLKFFANEYAIQLFLEYLNLQHNYADM